MSMTQISRRPFGTTSEGYPVDEYILTNAAGMKVCVINLGGIITALHVPVGKHTRNVVLGLNSVAAYERDPFYLGAIVGRYANRIARGRFALHGKTYVLATNNGVNHLHGGVRGLNKVIWNAAVEQGDHGELLCLRYVSADGEEGYPGELSVEVRYELTQACELIVSAQATITQACPVNLTFHSYFNLSGADTIHQHELELAADAMLPAGDTQIPTGERMKVSGTPFDFTKPHRVGDRLQHDMLRATRGYDHNWILRKDGASWGMAARLKTHDLTLEVYTDQPGMQVYTGNFLNGLFHPHQAICLEPQHFPDSPNHTDFPSTILEPGQRYFTRTVYRFV
jgi:aldose 1-epimerase